MSGDLPAAMAVVEDQWVLDENPFDGIGLSVCWIEDAALAPGRITLVAIDGNEVLVRYTHSEMDIEQSECPTGAIFFMMRDDYERWAARWALHDRPAQEERVKRLLRKQRWK